MSYGGDVSPEATYAALADDPAAVLVDVRTHPELAYVGYPDLSGLGKDVVMIEWQRFPTGSYNPEFIEELRARGVSEDAPVYFICRSGARSRFAAVAATAAGYGKAYNVAHGFEGPHDARGHRGTVAGWKVSELPWRQT